MITCPGVHLSVVWGLTCPELHFSGVQLSGVHLSGGSLVWGLTYLYQTEATERRSEHPYYPLTGGAPQVWGPLEVEKISDTTKHVPFIDTIAQSMYCRSCQQNVVI